MGAVRVGVSADRIDADFGTPLEQPPLPGAEPTPRNHLSLSETDREELARLRERYQMDQELGVD
jgi:hypothetical protein